MSVMATNSMTTSTVSGHVSAVVNHLDELHFDPMQNFVNINSTKNDELDAVGSVSGNALSSSAMPHFDHLSRMDEKFIGNKLELPVVQHSINNDLSSLQEPDEQVYANFSEIVKHDQLEDIDRRPIPPVPNLTTEPIRTLPNGWKEYKTLGGRSYYFHPNTNVCQWKPPRNQRGMSTSVTSQNFQSSQCEPSTSVSDTITEFPLRNEYDMACCSSDVINNHEVPDGMVQYQSALLKAQTNGESDQEAALSDLAANFHNYGNNKMTLFNNRTTPPPVLPNSHLEFSNGHNGQFATIEKCLPAYQMEQSIINALSQSRLSATAIRQGPLEKCRLCDSGVKVKKKEWTNSYAYLYSSHLLFYKDQKSAEKTGKHYPPPTDVCDLRGAILSYVDTEKQKDKRRKHVISLTLINKTMYLFSCPGNESDINGWFHALRQTISALPSVIPTYPVPAILDYGGSLQRSSIRTKTASSLKGNSAFGTKSSLHHSVKSKLRTSLSRENVENSLLTGSETNKQIETNLSRESIIERLLRFFRSRPTMESLCERGIYKPEPVFGSTLVAICAHEKSLVPKFLAEVTRLIEEKGLDIDGLYRVNGNLSSVQKIRCQIDQEKYESLENEDDVHVLTGALKLFFRELSEPIFPIFMNRDFMSGIREPNMRQRFKAIDELLSKLPVVNRETLKVLVNHLERVSTHSGKNRMQIHNLAIMFGPTLFGTEDRAAIRRNSADTKGRNTKRKSSDKKEENNPNQIEPNQNLAYKMVIYGQIVEFILTESKKFSIFQS